MKWITNGLPLLLILFTAVSSCENDDDDGQPRNGFVWQNDSYPTTSAFLNPVDRPGQSEGVFGYDLFLVSSGLTYSVEDGNFRGRGDVLVLELNANDSLQLANGSYELSPSATATEAFSIRASSRALIDYDVASQTGFSSTFSDGELMVTRSGNELGLSYRLTLVNGDEINGNFSGPTPAFP